VKILELLLIMVMSVIFLVIWGVFLYIGGLLFEDFNYIFAFFSGAFSLVLVETLMDYLAEKLNK